MSSNSGFKIPIEVKFINDQKGCGVFSKEYVKADTLIWTPSLVIKYTSDECSEILSKMNKNDANTWLRQSYVLESEPNVLCVNQTDEGRFVNHSSQPNCGYASVENPCVALRGIDPEEEITCDYSG